MENIIQILVYDGYLPIEALRIFEEDETEGTEEEIEEWGRNLFGDLWED